MTSKVVYASIYESMILIVDNNKRFSNYVHNLLSNEGFQHIVIANSCADALELCKLADKPYLIITEFNFKAMSGLELITQVKQHCNRVRVIVLSNSDEIADAFKSLQAGALSFIYRKDQDWEDAMIGSVRKWMHFYKEKEYRRISFRNKINSLTVA